VTPKSKSETPAPEKSAETVKGRRPTRWITAVDHPISAYANTVELRISNWDFRFKFGETIEQQNDELIAVERGRIIMSPQHTKAFLRVLSENLRKYEEAYGEIPTDLLVVPKTQ
jgi:hypothetical protein